MDHLGIQTPVTRQKGKRSIIFKVSTLLLIGASISGCNITMSGIHGNGEGIGYRQARFSEMNEMKASYRIAPRNLKTCGMNSLEDSK